GKKSFIKTRRSRNGLRESMMDTEETIYYGCQLKVSGFGAAGQEVLRNSKFLIVGMGGLGCPAALYLAPSGIGTLGLCDADTVDISNINRQILYGVEDVGEKKIAIARRQLSRQNPYIQIVLHDERIGEANWRRILSDYDLILDCTDNFHSKYLLHDACLQLGKPLVQGGVLQRCGQVYYFPFGKGQENLAGNWENQAESQDESQAEGQAEGQKEVPACLRCVWPQAPTPQNQADCNRSGVLSLVVGNVGLQQANIAVQERLGKRKRESVMFLYQWDALEWRRLALYRDPNCANCGPSPSGKQAAYLEQESLEVADVAEWAARIQGQRGPALVLDARRVQDQDVPWLRQQLAKQPGLPGVPEALGPLGANWGEEQVCGLEPEAFEDFTAYSSRLRQRFGEDATYLLVCYRGVSSLGMAEWLRREGLRAYSLRGGAAALK
ncbi:MAG: HesA/MoeB/ThiF family protein, partial [Spirochaetota bacterium]